MQDKTFTQSVRELVRASGKSIGTLSFDSRLKEAAIRKFLNGHTGMNTKSLDKLIGAVFPHGVAITAISSDQTAAVAEIQL